MFFSLCSVGEDISKRWVKSISYYSAPGLFEINPYLHSDPEEEHWIRESCKGWLACCLSFIKFFFFFSVLGCGNGGKAISSRPFNHVMTGLGSVSVCVCVNCGLIDQSQHWGDGIEGQGWPWTQQLPGSLPSIPTPLGLAQGHLSKFYLIPEVLDLSVTVYERGDWPPLWAFF